MNKVLITIEGGNLQLKVVAYSKPIQDVRGFCSQLIGQKEPVFVMLRTNQLYTKFQVWEDNLINVELSGNPDRNSSPLHDNSCSGEAYTSITKRVGVHTLALSIKQALEHHGVQVVFRDA